MEVLDSIVTAGPFPADPERPELAGNWTYTTVIARTKTGETLETTANEESLELRWVDIAAVDSLALMPAFAKAWHSLRKLLNTTE